MIIRVTKQFSFEMAHVLPDHHGACRNIHGHSYQLDVTIRGKAVEKPGDSANGMVMDFGELKKIVNEEVIHKYDHALMLPETYPVSSGPGYGKVIKVPFVPTCENLLSEMVKNLLPRLPQGVKLAQLKLRETATSYAEWNDRDQG